MSPTFRALHVRNYRLYALGGVVSNTGTWMQRIAQDWLVLQLHGGSEAQAATALGITTGLQFLPILLFSAYAGLVADRISKRRMLQLTQAFMGLTAGVLAVLALTGVAQPWMVYLIAFVFGTGTAFDAPARQSFVSEMVGPEDLTNAVGLNSASFNLARLVGPALSGLLIAAFGSGVRATGLVIALNAVSYLTVILALRAMRGAELTPTAPVSRGRGQLREGLAYVRGRRDIMLILAVIFFVGTFGMNFQITSALMATQVYGKGAGEYGLLGTTLAIGSLSGALIGARRTTRPRMRLVVGAALAFGVLEVAAGLMPTYLAFAVLTPALGLSTLLMMNAANTYVQLGTQPAMRGRVLALYLMIFQGGTPVGAPIIGWVGGTLGARWTMIGGGAIAVVGVLLAVAVFSGGPRLRYRRGRRSRTGVEVEAEEAALAA
ncbi:MFS transporter [Marmoricola endophyticus]|uniref:MFS transporter n=1 Tax=Marmoricola endophyticus TaxID=2040280 RepID=A0A917BHQ8_9ACTN|nr:MFS transporter [Marmoricola endophyticus]GGF41922.1 MFS transporter [Marmoricola endophyticus]